jgi:hypothetical protein
MLSKAVFELDHQYQRRRIYKAFESKRSSSSRFENPVQLAADKYSTANSGIKKDLQNG